MLCATRNLPVPPCVCASTRVRWSLRSKTTASAIRKQASHGLGLVSMRERSDLVNGTIEFLRGKTGGALVRATAPYHPLETHAGD